MLRLGWSLTGKVNSPAEPASTGLEVGKLDAQAVRRYVASYLDLYKDASGGKLGPEGIQTLLTDSWEAGVQNWTPAMLDEFRARRGYEPTPFLPVLTGRVVGSSDLSERFLFDFRQTLKDLVADNHNGIIASELRSRGMSYYTEGLGDSTRGIVDGMTLKARADIPTAEFWYRPFRDVAGPAAAESRSRRGGVRGSCIWEDAGCRRGADSRCAVGSVGLLAGHAQAGSRRDLRSRRQSHPVARISSPAAWSMPSRACGCLSLASSSTAMIAWAEHAAPWVSYLSRTSFMLQQGRFVADVAYFYGEERSLTEQFLERINTDVPKGYAYDYVNPEALLTLLSVRDGRIVTPSGMSYRVLFMPDQVRRLTLPALRKVRALVEEGAVLVGKKPLGGLGLQSSDEDVERIALELWGDGAAEGRQLGKGRVYTNLAAALEAEQVPS